MEDTCTFGSRRTVSGDLPEKVDKPVLPMVSQSCRKPDAPAEAVLKTKLPP